MQKILFATLFIALSMPAFATDSGDAAFDILAKYSTEKQQTNFFKLQSSISKADAVNIDAEISKIYGTPSRSRGGLKVWEVENKTGNGAKHTTIMCGPDGNGGVFISADRRGPKSNRANTKAERQVDKQAEKQALRLKQAQAKASKSALTSQQSD